MATRNSFNMSRSPTKSPLFDPGCPPATNDFHQYPKSQLWDYLDASADLGIHRKVRGSTDHHRHQLRDQTQLFLLVLLCAPCARSVRIKERRAHAQLLKGLPHITSPRRAGVSSPWERRTSLRLPCWLTCAFSFLRSLRSDFVWLLAGMNESNRMSRESSQGLVRT